MTQHSPTEPATSSSPTQASTVGVLPDSIGVVLLTLVTIGVVTIGVGLGYPVEYVTALIVTGLLAAIGLRTAVTPDRMYVALGISILWGAALAFGITTTALVAKMPGLIIPSIVAAAATLGPFSILGSTIKSYGHGAGRTVIKQYITGTVVVACVIVGVVTVSIFNGTVLSITAALFSGVIGGVNGSGPWQRIIVGLVVYTAFIYTARKSIHDLPIEALVTPRDFDRLDDARATVDRTHFYTRFLIIGYAFVSLGVYSQVVKEGSTRMTEIGLLVIQAVVFPPLLMLVAAVTVVLLVALLTVTATRKLSGVTGIDIVKTLLPPVILIVVTIIGTVLFAEQITNGILTGLPPEIARSGTPLYDLVTADPPLIALLVLPFGLVFAAGVFSLPTVIAALGTGDASLAGIASGTVSLAILVIVAALTHQPAFVIVGGVVIAAVVWELGEYSIVAIGETQSPSIDRSVPDGFAFLTAVHAAVIGVVAVVAVTVAAIATVVFAGVTITETTAALALILCSIAVAAILLVLSG